MEGLVEIAPIPPVPLHDLLIYSLPVPMLDRVRLGMRVRIPLGRQTRTGVVAGFTTAPPTMPVRAVLDILDTAEPFLTPDLLELCRWTSRYYLAPLAEVLATIVPASLPTGRDPQGLHLVRLLDADEETRMSRRAPARARVHTALAAAPGHTLSPEAARTLGLSTAAIRELRRAGLVELIDLPAPPMAAALEPRHDLTPAQQTAADAVIGAVANGQHQTFLLHGITGSGKTEVFLTAAEQTLKRGRGVLVLVPEIALTHQLVERVRARLGGTVALLHSGLAPGPRWREWQRVRTGAARVVVGARSAVFAPLDNVGLVVVDEEQDAAYKQEDGLRYNARDLAVVRGRLAGAAVVLASATPSAESYQAAREGRHQLLTLTERPTAQPLPSVQVVDLRVKPHPAERRGIVSDALRDALELNLGRDGQTLIFLNRRGYATYLQCPACGTTAACPNCSVTLTWHRGAGSLTCHHCHYRRRPPATCEACSGPALAAFGVGTEQIEAGLRTCYPLAQIDRLDRDNAQRPSAQRRILAEWRDGSTDILVGTQMVSKGHDVPGVTLVGVLLADLSLNVPDFRASERTFALLAQVAGRAGRGSERGEVIIQTFRPDHPAVAAARLHDYDGFMRPELERRRALGYPPFARLINLRLDGPKPEAVEVAARDLAEVLRRSAAETGMDDRTVLGPAPPPVERVRGRHRWQVLLRGAEVPKLRAMARLARTREEALRRAGVRLLVDVDPYSM